MPTAILECQKNSSYAAQVHPNDAECYDVSLANMDQKSACLPVVRGEELVWGKTAVAPMSAVNVSYYSRKCQVRTLK